MSSEVLVEDAACKHVKQIGIAGVTDLVSLCSERNVCIDAARSLSLPLVGSSRHTTPHLSGAPHTSLGTPSSSYNGDLIRPESVHEESEGDGSLSLSLED